MPPKVLNKPNYRYLHFSNDRAHASPRIFYKTLQLEYRAIAGGRSPEPTAGQGGRTNAPGGVADNNNSSPFFVQQDPKACRDMIRMKHIIHTSSWSWYSSNLSHMVYACLGLILVHSINVTTDGLMDKHGTRYTFFRGGLNGLRTLETCLPKQNFSKISLHRSPKPTPRRVSHAVCHMLHMFCLTSTMPSMRRSPNPICMSTRFAKFPLQVLLFETNQSLPGKYIDHQSQLP